MERITQSFIKDMRSYMKGDLCGNIIRERWVNDRLLDDDREPGAMELGAYFEFLLTGALPKNGNVPQPQYMISRVKANGGKTAGLGVDAMYDEYRKVHKNVEVVRGYIKAIGLKQIRSGFKLMKGRHEGTIDIECEVVEVVQGFTWKVGDRIIIDTKYSGLISETTPWSNKHGWKWSPVQKEYHGTQAIEYHFISNLPFYFLVTQSNNDKDELPIVKLFHVPVTEFMIEQHLTEANDLLAKFEFYRDMTGFKPRPELNKCSKCSLFNECTDKAIYPLIEVVDLTID